MSARPTPAGEQARRDRPRREVSAGGVVVRRPGPETRFLIIRDSYGHWGLPKGHLESGEPSERAAVREVREETGLASVRVLAPIATIEWEFRFRGRHVHKRCQFFLMESESDETRPQESEGITECRWASASEALDLIGYENARHVLRQAEAILATLPGHDA